MITRTWGVNILNKKNWPDKYNGINFTIYPIKDKKKAYKFAKLNGAKNSLGGYINGKYYDQSKWRNQEI